MPCQVPGCKTPRDRVQRHHLVARTDDGPVARWNVFLLCIGHHAEYEQLERAGRDTPLTKLVNAARDHARQRLPESR